MSIKAMIKKQMKEVRKQLVEAVNSRDEESEYLLRGKIRVLNKSRKYWKV